MNSRILAAAALTLLSAWLLWQGLSAVIMITGRGSPLGDALLQPPTSLIRILGASIILIGALLALTQRAGGALLAAVGTVLFLLLPVLMAASGADSDMWMDEAIFSAVLIALTIALFVIKRRKA
jgi:Mn2+/Fe2+ NRAMP family transporter